MRYNIFKSFKRLLKKQYDEVPEKEELHEPGVPAAKQLALQVYHDTTLSGVGTQFDPLRVTETVKSFVYNYGSMTANQYAQVNLTYSNVPYDARVIGVYAGNQGSTGMVVVRVDSDCIDLNGRVTEKLKVYLYNASTSLVSMARIYISYITE